MSTIKYDNHNPPRRPRDRSVPRKNQWLEITPRDMVWAEKIHRHGDLPAPFLHEYTKHMRGGTNGDAARTRLRKLFHQHEWFIRPDQQFRTSRARENTCVYGNGFGANDRLKDDGLWREYAPHTRDDHWLHDHAAACVTASIEIATLGTDYEFGFGDVVMDDADRGLWFDVDYYEHDKNVLLKPDRLCYIRYPNGKVRFFIVEIDRGTEQMRGRKVNKKTIERMAVQYHKLFTEKRYKQLVGVDGGVLVLNVTSSARRMETMMEVWEKVYGGGSIQHALFTHLPYFGRRYQPPSDPLTHLFTDPLARVNAEPYAICTPSWRMSSTLGNRKLPIGSGTVRYRFPRAQRARISRMATASEPSTH